jgi:DNA-binding transcriptional MerR regulator
MIKLNVTEFAKEMGISRRTLYRYIEKGLITPRVSSFNGQRYFTEEDVLKYKEYEEIQCQQTTLN